MKAFMEQNKKEQEKAAEDEFEDLFGSWAWIGGINAVLVCESVLALILVLILLLQKLIKFFTAVGLEYQSPPPLSLVTNK